MNKRILLSSIITVLFFVNFTLQNTFAGIRTVGNGGGLAEMKAYVLANKLPFLINYCLSPETNCGWSTNSAIQITKLTKQIDLNSLKLIAPFNEISKYDLKENTLYIHSNDLYTNSTPNNFGEILNTFLRILIRDTLEIENKEPFTISLLDNLENNIISINIKNHNKVVHFVASSESVPESLSLQFLALENEKETLDLTTVMLQKINCQSAKWRITNWNYDSISSQLHLEIHWKCGFDSFGAELNILFQDDSEYKMQIKRKLKE